MSGLLQFGHAPTGITTFTQGFIGGGGYQMQMSFANDGTRFLHTDVAGSYKWNPSTGKWFDGAQTWNRLDNIRKVTLQASQWISGNPDNYGHVLVACGQAGYVDGTIS